MERVRALIDRTPIDRGRRDMTTYRRDPATDPHLSFDPASVAPYTLPAILRHADGSAVTDLDSWRAGRRLEILDAFATHVYGCTPAAAAPMRVDVRQRDPQALDATATRSEIACVIGDGDTTATMTLLVYTPNGVDRAPAFLGFNFWGNHTVDPDPAITLPTGWMPDRPDKGVLDHRATAAGRGCMAHRWPLERILGRGYAVATAHYGDLSPDHEDKYRSGVYRLWYSETQARTPHLWGAIGVWAWGLSRALDYLITDDRVDANRVAVLGHSRLGKTALWAAAQDTRFAMAIANNSGCGGASLFRHTLGERLHVLARLRRYWFCPAFADYQLAEHALPVDQHMLLALIAPRPLYVASATQDHWADPVGEYLATREAGTAYRLHGRAGLQTDRMPEPDRPVVGTVSYHLRTGGHDLTAYDWDQFMDAADEQMPKRATR